MCAAENINHKQLNSITYLLSRQTHNKTFLLSRPTNKYIRGEVRVGEEQKHTALGKHFHHHNKLRTKAALWRAELIKQNDYYRRMAIDSEWKQAALRRGASACFRHKDFWTTWNNDSFPVIGAGRDCPICHIKKNEKRSERFHSYLGQKNILTNLVNQLTQDETTTTAERKRKYQSRRRTSNNNGT